ncbi:uncharacterized protein [Palaemon carinicauda]|uniref:uncharacterized protein isoform X1 n=1 Tax=Palaemon carinicauda TaxID=392227 RepID=UPI0035B5870D
MADLRQCSREFLTEFIALYESFPCIWRVKSKDYSDRDKKGKAYESLVEKFKEIDKNADRDMVVKKINSLRTVYRKELAKVNDSNRSGTEEEIYKPSLWYFDLLHFLNDQETLRHSRNTMDEIQETAVDEPPEQGDGSTTEQSFTRIPLKKKIKMDKREELLTLACKRLCDTDDEYDKIASAWAAELQKMSPTQMPFAKKAINDILFEGQLGTLHRHSVVINGAMSMSTTNAAEPPDDDEMPTCSNAPSVKWTCSNTTKSDQILDLVARNLYQRYEERDSANETFGKYVGQKLDSLDTKTSSFAIKMINDVLYEAENGNLKVPL